MGAVTFRARRSMMPGREYDELVGLALDFQDAVRRRDVRKFTHRASAGGMETLYEGADTIWDFETEPVCGDQYARVREFMDSTVSGESFQIWPYGSEAAPITLKRRDSGYQPQPFSRSDRAEADFFTFRFSGIEL